PQYKFACTLLSSYTFKTACLDTCKFAINPASTEFTGTFVFLQQRETSIVVLLITAWRAPTKSAILASQNQLLVAHTRRP
ncbi:hypothetical protein KCU77_g20424, partial [Aureobasidium melanogenum]